jgi:predicted transposase YbfD/YdcC
MHNTSVASPLANRISTKAEKVAAATLVSALNLAHLQALFAQLDDPRAGRPNHHYPLCAMLLAALLALLCNHLNELAIAQWLADQPLAFRQALGFRDAQCPHQTTFHRLFARLVPRPIETALTGVFAAKAVGELPPRGTEGIAVDGKAQRTRAKFEQAESLGAKGTPCHLLSLFSHLFGTVLAQCSIQNKEAELTVAPDLIAQIEWLGRVLTGDAIFCQRNLCVQVVEAGGDYFFAVKSNQPNLEDAIRLLFEPPSEAETRRVGFEAPAPLAITTGKVAEVGHGRVEVRQIKASSELAEYANWPYLAQVVEIKRTWRTQRNGVYLEQSESWLGVTSLPREVADLKRLLELKREHWGIENRLHWVRDVVFGEDKSTLHKGSGAQLLAILRNLALNLLRLAGIERITETLRWFGRKSERAFNFLGVELNA